MKQRAMSGRGNTYIYLKIFRGKLKAVTGAGTNKIISLGFMKDSLPLLTIGGGKELKAKERSCELCLERWILRFFCA